jgi:glycosyltransferase involved in cell wall biosynthesis
LHILFLTDNFPPEVNAPATRTYDHAIRWVAEGCKVTVITCFPNFPEGRVFPGYKNRWYQSEVIDGINVVRVKTFMTANKGFFLRTLDYLTFMISGFLAGLFQKKPDIIVATSPQFFTAVAGWLLSICRRRPFVFELRDIWPASIIAVGAMKKSLLIKALEWLELFLYKHADAIVSLTNSFKKELVERGVDPDKIFVVLNGVDLDFYQPLFSKSQNLAKKHFIENKFIVGYIGTHGLAHGLEVVIEAAKILKHYPDILFMLVGSGASKDDLVRVAKSQQLDNIRFIDTQPKNLMKSYYSLCDISLIHLKNSQVFSKVIPSKLFESMGMGIPILIALPLGEATKIVNDFSCGVIIEPENAKQLAQSVLDLQSNTKQFKSYKKSALKASTYFSRDINAKEMLNVFKEVLSK